MDSKLGDQLVELAEIKYAQLCGIQSEGAESVRKELPSRQMQAALWAIGLVVGEYIEDMGLELDALWAAVDPDARDD